MAFFPGSSSAPASSATPRAVEEDHIPFSASSSTGTRGYKTIIILGVSIHIPMTETSSTTTGDFMAVDETIPAVISSNTQGSVVQPVNLPVQHPDIPMEDQSVSPDLMEVAGETTSVISSNTQAGSAVEAPHDSAIRREEDWRIKKNLLKSDTDGSSRLLLGKQLVKDHILPYIGEFDGKQGTKLDVYDVDTRTEHTLLLKTWQTESFVLVKGWMKDFVRRRKLHMNDIIGLRWEENDARFEFTVLRRTT